jgi:xanthosine utilization system XapX-like protein
MAFTIEGEIIPAPSALALLGLGGLVAGRRRR